MTPSIVRATSRRRFLQFLGGKPAVRLGRDLGLRDGNSLQAARSDDMGACDRRLDQVAERRHQRVRFRASGAQERPARAFRLHGVGHRRRGHAACEPRGVPEVPATAAPAKRRLKSRHERGAVRHQIRFADLHQPDRRQQILPPGWGVRRRQGSARWQPSANPVDVVERFRGRRHQGARGANLVPALCLAAMGSRASADQAR